MSVRNTWKSDLKAWIFDVIFVFSSVIHNCIFINFLIDITPFCDCEDRPPEYITPNIGVLASKDMVAIDQATIDLIGKHLFKGDPAIQVKEAHRLGLGEVKYEICMV